MQFVKKTSSRRSLAGLLIKLSVALIVILIIASLSIALNNQNPPLNCSSENRDDRDDTCPIEIASWNLNVWSKFNSIKSVKVINK